MIASIGERLAAKLGNANDNAFKMRRLFKMYDTEATGCIHLEDLRMMMETFGIQLDDDSLLALYHVYDQECTGYLKYEDLMRVLLDEDVFALYTGNNDVTQSSLDLETVRKMVRTIQAKFKSSVEDLRKVLECLDTGKTGLLLSNAKDFLEYSKPQPASTTHGCNGSWLYSIVRCILQGFWLLKTSWPGALLWV